MLQARPISGDNGLTKLSIKAAGRCTRRPLVEPILQRQIAIGEKGFAFVGPHNVGTVDYRAGRCPIAEDFYENPTITNPYLYPPLTLADMKDTADAFDKVTEHFH